MGRALPFTVTRLGRTAYQDAHRVQRDHHARRVAGEIGDALLLTEHDPVITLGRGADTRHLRVTELELQRLGVSLVPVERGGDITWHGPGQLVAYPIIDLRAYGRDVHRYVRTLEEAAIWLLATYDLAGERRPGTPGVWLGPAKVASVGVYVSRWVTMHGLAVNVDPDLRAFDLIHACGLVGMPLTSIAEALNQPLSIVDAFERFVACFDGALAMARSGRPEPIGTEQSFPT